MKTKKLLLPVFLFLISTYSYAQTISGKLNFKPGQQIEVNSSIKSLFSQEVMGQTIDITVNGGSTHFYKVTNTTADNSTLNHTTKRIVFSFEGMGQDKSFDSEKKEDLDGDMGQPFKEALAKTYDIVIDPYGKVLAVRKGDPVKKEKAAANGNMLAGLSTQIVASLEPPKPGDASLFKILPEKEVAKGDSWADSSSSESIKENNVYTITDITGSEVLIDFTTISSSKTKAEMMGMETTTNLKGKTSGKIIVDKTTGLLKQKTSTGESAGTVDAQGQNFPLSVKVSTTLTVKAP